MSTRACGHCRECCSIMSVGEWLGKPSHTPCNHLCSTGCAIYANKPRSCTEWRCGWLRGDLSGDEQRRPDKLGVLFDTADVVNTIRIYECRPHAFAERKRQIDFLVNKIKQRWNTITIVYIPFRTTPIASGDRWYDTSKGWADMNGMDNVYQPVGDDPHVLEIVATKPADADDCDDAILSTSA